MTQNIRGRIECYRHLIRFKLNKLDPHYFLIKYSLNLYYHSTTMTHKHTLHLSIQKPITVCVTTKNLSLETRINPQFNPQLIHDNPQFNPQLIHDNPQFLILLLILFCNGREVGVYLLLSELHKLGVVTADNTNLD